MVKAMAVFDLDPSRWHELAADRAVGCDAPCGHSAHSVPHATACTRADADISLPCTASARCGGGYYDRDKEFACCFVALYGERRAARWGRRLDRPHELDRPMAL